MQLKNPKIIRQLLVFNAIAGSVLLLTGILLNIPYNTLDHKINDLFYSFALSQGKGPQISNRVVLLNIDDQTYKLIGRNSLDRKVIADANNTLAMYTPNAVIYDIIFPQPSDHEADSAFSESISTLGTVYLPAGFALDKEPKEFRWGNGVFFERLHDEYLQKPEELNSGSPYVASRALAQYDDFAAAAHGSGHISSFPDADGIYRHYPLLVKIDSLFFPTVTLQAFLDNMGIAFSELKINWGESITVPAKKESFLSQDLVIPIDESGNVFIPYPVKWNDFKNKMSLHKMMERSLDEDLNDEMTETFEGSYVFVGDISSGISDLGNTTLEADIPLVYIHSSLMNSMLTGNFYSKWSSLSVWLSLILVLVLLTISALPKNNIFQHGVFLSVILVFIGITFYNILNFQLMPLGTILVMVTLFYATQTIMLQLIISRQEAFIKDAFSRYLNAKVIDRLIDDPELLKLGGEEKEVTILFTDIAGFTSISEQLKPADLVYLLNHYLTEMTSIVTLNGGMVDKFIGDAIMAEFGAPLKMDNPADGAISTGLMMHDKLKELNAQWQKRGLPPVWMRAGINTGRVIIGNMGSEQVFDYTVIGDPVNLASRLEGANKYYGTHLMISESTFNIMSKDKFRYRILDCIKVKGKDKPVKVYNIYGKTEDQIPQSEIDYCSLYDQAFELYLKMDFDSSVELLKKCLEIKPDDKAASEMIIRNKYLIAIPPPPDWDGSFTMTSK